MGTSATIDRGRRVIWILVLAWCGITVPVSCSVGVATGPRASADDLLRDADVAMCRAKVGGKGGYAVFSTSRDGGAKGSAGVRSGA